MPAVSAPSIHPVPQPSPALPAPAAPPPASTDAAAARALAGALDVLTAGVAGLSLVAPPARPSPELPAIGRAPSADAPARAPEPARAHDARTTRGRVAIRLDAALDTSRTALVARRAVYAETIQRHEATITGLETELAAIHQRIATKTGDVRDLVARKQRLTAEIANNRRMATAAGVYGGILAFFTGPVGVALGGGMAATAAVAVTKLSSDLSSAERSERDARSTLDGLERSSRAFEQARAASAERLGRLRAEHQALTASAPVIPPDATPRAAVEALEAAVKNDEAIIGNLEAQIQALRTAKAQATTFEAGLDTLIERLQTEVAALEKQVEESRRALLGALVDVALAGFGATALLRKAGLPLADKTALLAGIDALRGDLAAAVNKLVDGLVSSAVVTATDSPLLAKVLGAITTAPLTGADAAERLATLAAAATRPLTAPQRALLERIAA